MNTEMIRFKQLKEQSFSDPEISSGDYQDQYFDDQIDDFIPF